MIQYFCEMCDAYVLALRRKDNIFVCDKCNEKYPIKDDPRYPLKDEID